MTDDTHDDMSSMVESSENSSPTTRVGTGKTARLAQGFADQADEDAASPEWIDPKGETGRGDTEW